MTIEFADPGYNWAFVWWPVVILVMAIIATIILVSMDLEELVGPILGIPIAGVLIVPTFFGIQAYYSVVSDLKEYALVAEGFSNVEVADDRFTAATEDGKYFEGVLVDLRPESGYAYRVLELTETGE